jgi:ATP-dependent Clp protease adapter protein ClpS
MLEWVNPYQEVRHASSKREALSIHEEGEGCCGCCGEEAEEAPIQQAVLRYGGSEEASWNTR